MPFFMSCSIAIHALFLLSEELFTHYLTYTTGYLRPQRKRCIVLRSFALFGNNGQREGLKKVEYLR
jgi:hypothetical protein